MSSFGAFESVVLEDVCPGVVLHVLPSADEKTFVSGRSNGHAYYHHPTYLGALTSRLTRVEVLNPLATKTS